MSLVVNWRVVAEDLMKCLDIMVRSGVPRLGRLKTGQSKYRTDDSRRRQPKYR